MIKTEELCKLYSVKDKGKKWYSEEEIKKAISKCYSYGHAEPLTEYYNDKDDNLICIAELEEHLFAPDLNSRSSDEDSLNKDLTATQQVASPKSATQTSLNPYITKTIETIKTLNKK